MTKSEPLQAVKKLLAAFEASGVVYCHWKSNQHIEASMLGDTDLDVLVGRGQTEALQTALADAGYKRFQASAGTVYPGVEDYIGFDAATGRIVHLHLHHFLTLGEPHLKGYRLPWETTALETRIRDEEFGIDMTSREMELLLLLVRQVLKQRFRKRIARLLGRGKESKDFRNEFDWLMERADRGAVLDLARKLLGEEAALSLTRTLDHNATPDAVRQFGKDIRALLKPYRSYARPTSVLAAMYREAYWILGGISKRKVPLGIPLRRINPRGGLAIAFLGSDGAGKSTLLADTRKWLGQKLDVYPIYMGSGDGSASLLRLPLKLARRVVEGSVDGSEKTKDSSGEKRKKSGFRKAGKLPWALSLAAEKRGKLKRLVRARNRGLVVICDRFPQNQTKGFNDGPLLDGYRDDDSGWLKKAALWEAGAYDLAAATPPDLVIKLVPSTETAMERRPELPREEIQRRIDAVLGFKFAKPAKVVEINADQPLEDVIREVRSVIWDML